MAVKSPSAIRASASSARRSTGPIHSPQLLYARTGFGSPPRSLTSGSPAAWARTSHALMSTPASARPTSPGVPSRVSRVRSFASSANGATGSPFTMSLIASTQPTMGFSVHGANAKRYERPVGPSSVSRSTSTSAASGRPPLADTGGRLNGTRTGLARMLRIFGAVMRNSRQDIIARTRRAVCSRTFAGGRWWFGGRNEKSSRDERELWEESSRRRRSRPDDRSATAAPARRRPKPPRRRDRYGPGAWRSR